MFLGLNAEAWAALGQMLLGVAAVLGGGRALYIYSQSRRHEAATWLQGIYRDFYLAENFINIRQVLEYHYADAAPLLTRRIEDPTLPTTPDEEQLLGELDMLLNYFELVLYLEEKRRFPKKDRQAMLDYWLDLISEPHLEELRRYVVRFKFRRVARALEAQRLPGRTLL
jgi:hypothetical protein